MSAIGYGDELVRDYLLFRGFLQSLKVFDAEVKADKDKGFRPDRIVDYFSSCIVNLDLAALRESWAHFDQRFFARLEHSFLGTAKKLETALLRMYLVTCVSSSRQDKLLNFFEQMTSDLQGLPEWKEWFALPFIKNADEHPTFAPFFNRQWQDTMLLSLHNFLSVVFQSAAMPVLLSYEEELIKMQQLSEENEMLKKRLSALQSGKPMEASKLPQEKESHSVRIPSELMDDFYVIAQETPPESSGRSIKSLIRNISGGGIPTSPVMSRRPTEARKAEESSSSSKQVKVKPRSPSVPPSRSLSVFESSRSRKDSPETSRSTSKEESPPVQTKLEHVQSKPLVPDLSAQCSVKPAKEDTSNGFIILSCEKYSEHNSRISHCKFNCSGTSVASSDMDGVIKIWNAVPSISTQSTVIMSRTSVLSLEWDRKRERLLLYGGATGIVRVYDTKDRRVVKEILTDSNSNSNQRILCICCNPLGTNFVTSTCLKEEGELRLWDMKTLTLERRLLPLTDKSTINCCSFNHNGQLLLVGLSNGNSSILDLRTSEIIATWPTHKGGVYSTEFNSDETACYTMGNDQKLCSWSAHKIGENLECIKLPSEGMDVPESQGGCAYGRRFCFNNDGSYVLICGPLGGVVYNISNSAGTPVLDIGGHNKPVSTVDWLAAMESSTCICGTVDGKVIVSTLLNQ